MTRLESFRRYRGDERGQVVVLTAIMFMTMLFAVGLAVDAGQLFVAKRTEQEAADAASFAGAIVIYQGGVNPPSAVTVQAAKDAAVADATRNGFTASVDNTTVVVNSPPTSGAYSGDVNHVEVIITRQVRTALVPAQSVLNPVRARSVSGAQPLQNGYAIMSLNRGNTPNALWSQNGADIHLTGGGILVNSTASDAANNGQTSCSRFTVSGGAINIAGGSTSAWPTGCTPAFPAVIPASPQRPDPFALFPRPSTAGLPVCNSLAACQDGLGNQIPGVYKVVVGGAGGTTIKLNSGIYILEAGVNGTGNADIISNAGGVFLFNTLDSYPAAGGTCAGLTLAGNAVTTLAPMTTGVYANFSVYQDPACTAPMKVAGNGSFNGSGTIYLPSASFTFAGNNATLTGSQLIANTVNLQNGNITIDYNTGTTAQPILPRMAE